MSPTTICYYTYATSWWSFFI